MRSQTLLRSRLLFVVILLVSAHASRTMGQSTIFNVPSSDVQAPRKVYLEADFITHFASYKDGGYQTYGPRVVVGLPGNTEVGLNAFYTRASTGEPVEIQPNFKWQFYNNEKNGMALAAGVLLTIPATRRHEGKTTGMLYVVGSKTFPGNHGPRLTFGGYRLAGPFEPGSDRTGVIAAYEQPVTAKFSFVTDWFSGKNDIGYVTAGAGITLSPKQNIYAGYSFGNEGRGNNSLGVYYGYSF
ncbi:MAG: hypothetical protein QOD33_165 [Pyrinomonadaceae bacterium]|nr:hypothetical protein [Pyrinomonadaceae bacterium]